MRQGVLRKVVRVSLRLKIAQKPFIVWSLGPKASYYESLEPYRVSVGR